MKKANTITRGMPQHPRSTATAPVQKAATPDPLIGRYWNGSTFEEQKFFDETFSLQGGANEGLHRDLDGHLFIKRYEFNERGTKVTRVHLRAVSYAEACDWLVRDGQLRPPEKFLAFHGIHGPAAVQQGPAATKAESVRVSADLSGRGTLNRINAPAQAVDGSAAAAEEPAAWLQETMVSLCEAAGRPSLPHVILGPSLYAKVREEARKCGLSTSDLVLAVFWTEITNDEEVRKTIRSEDWFMPAARQMVRSANKTRQPLADAQPQSRTLSRRRQEPAVRSRKGGGR